MTPRRRERPPLETSNGKPSLRRKIELRPTGAVTRAYARITTEIKQMDFMEEHLLAEATTINQNPDFTTECSTDCIKILTADAYTFYEDGNTLIAHFPWSNEILVAYNSDDRTVYSTYKHDVLLNLLRMCRGFHAERKLPFNNIMFENMIEAAWNMGINVEVFYRLKLAMRDRGLMGMAKQYGADDVQRAILFSDGWIYNKDEPKETE